MAAFAFLLLILTVVIIILLCFPSRNIFGTTFPYETDYKTYSIVV